MSTIETELHDALLDIAPNAFTREDQAVLIAEASEIFKHNETRYAQKKTVTASDREAYIADALLEAMRLAEMNDDYYEAEAEDAIYIESSNANPSQILKKIENHNRFSSNGFGSMDIINEDDVDKLLNPDYDEDTLGNYSLDDGFDIHNPQLYDAPNTGRHKSDSTVSNPYQ